MKKIKRILALLGVIFLLGLYVLTLISAFTDDPDTMSYFSAALLATVIIPALMWAYSFIYRLLRQHGEESAGSLSSAERPDYDTADEQKERTGDRESDS